MAPPNVEPGSSPPLYGPLDKSQREIRLLEIISKSPSDKVECKLHTVLLTPETYYACLSYVWGDPSVTEEIIVDGVSRQVTVNLATALRYVKKQWTEVELESDPELDTFKFRLWADALCINQEDDAERTHQVKMMADIYSGADMVLAWLSSNNDDVDVDGGFKVLKHVYQVLKSWSSGVHIRAMTEYEMYDFAKSYLQVGGIRGREDFYWLVPEAAGDNSNSAMYSHTDDNFAKIVDFISLDFWTRVWIQQEIFLAKKLYYITPSNRISYRSCCTAILGLVAFLEYLQRLVDEPQHPVQQWRDQIFTLPGLLVQMTLTAKVKSARDESEASGYWQAGYIDIYLSRTLHATEPLDYVYGLLAITKAPIIPDYTRDVRDVNIEFMKWVFDAWGKCFQYQTAEDAQNTMCGQLLNVFAVGTRRHGWPSWAPVFNPQEKGARVTVHSKPEECVLRGVPELWNSIPVTFTGDSLWAKAIKLQVVKKVYEDPISPDFMTKLGPFYERFRKEVPETCLNGRTSTEALTCALLKREICPYDPKKLQHWIAISSNSIRIARPDKEDLMLVRDPSYRESVHTEWTRAGEMYDGHRLFYTKDWYIGSMPYEVKSEDVVCVLAGCHELAVIHPVGNHFLFVGCCFMMGLMNAEVAADLHDSGRVTIEEIEIR